MINNETPGVSDLGKALARGPAQIMLQPGIIGGLLVLGGVFAHSVPAGIGAIIGLFFGTATSAIRKYPKDDIISGLYGYNGALVGIALFSLYEANIVLLLLSAIGGVLSSVVLFAMKKRHLPPYTFPFVLVTWVFIAVLESFGFSQMSSVPIGAVREFGNALRSILIIGDVFTGVGQVVLQQNPITGVLLGIAVVISSREGAIFALAGSFVGLGLGYLLGLPDELLNGGFLGYNAVLCGIVFSGRGVSAWFWALLAMVLATAFFVAFDALLLPALTFPFVAAVWIVSLLRNGANQHRQDKAPR